MKLRNMFLGLALGLSLTACAGGAVKQGVYTCTSIATLADVATEANKAHKLSKEDSDKIAAALDHAATVCESPTAPTSASLRTIAVGELVQLLKDKGVLHD